MSVTDQQVHAGQAAYSRRTLAAYDLIVLGVSNRFIWKCPTRRLMQLYNRYASDNHLDVGVGSGYFLDHCRFGSASPRIALLDLNRQAIDFAARRIARFQPERYQRNILKPLALGCRRFDSVSINYLLHCIPGADMHAKSVVFDHLVPCLNPGALLFGSTLLSHGVSPGWTARRLMRIYNAKGIFANQADALSDLEEALRSRFCDVRLETCGAAAIFAARLE